MAFVALRAPAHSSRAPLTDTAQAGPGDYESAWTGPFEIKPSTILTNAIIFCTNRASTGDAYYAADQAANRLQTGPKTSKYK